MRPIRRWYVAALPMALSAVFALAFPASADERIINLHSEVRIREDRVVEVREEITANVEGRDIKRGIIRDYPLKEPGSSDVIQFKPISASVDGVPLSKVETMREGDVASVVLGDRNKTLSMGEHTFVLVYETSPHVFNRDDFEEFPWNVTGEWDFAIDKASCRVILPPGEVVLDANGWSGRQGSRDSAATVERVDGGVLLTAAAPIPEKGGLSIGVAFAPEGSERAAKTGDAAAAGQPLGLLGASRGGKGAESFRSEVEIGADGSLTVTEKVALKPGTVPPGHVYRHPLNPAIGDVKVLSAKVNGRTVNKPYPTTDENGAPILSVNYGMFFLNPDRESKFAIELWYTCDNATSIADGAGELTWSAPGPAWEYNTDSVVFEIESRCGNILKMEAATTAAPGAPPDLVTREVDSKRFEVAAKDVQAGGELTVRAQYDPTPPPEPPPAPDPEPHPDGGGALTNIGIFASAVVHSIPVLGDAADFLGTGGVAAIFLSLVYYFATWFIFGRDPKRGTVIPVFYPPKTDNTGNPTAEGDESMRMSPAAVEYVMEHTRLSERGFSSVFLSLALRGLARIFKGASFKYSIAPLENEEALKNASPEEKAVYERLKNAADADKGIVVESKNHLIFGGMRSTVSLALGRRYARLWSLNGAFKYVNWLCVFPLGALLSSRGDSQQVGQVFLVLAILAAFIFFARAWLTEGAADAANSVGAISPRTLFSGLKLVFFLCIMGSGCLKGLAIAAMGMVGLIFHVLSPAVIVLAALPMIFNPLMKAPSIAGRRLMDEIEGLKMYIEAAEKDRLAAFNPPDDTPEVFERLLPYATVLGLEKTWCDRFAGQIAAGLIAPATIPSGSLSNTGMSSFVRDFDRQTTSARTPPPPKPARTYASRDNDDGGWFSGGGGGSWFSGGGGGGSVGGGRGGGGGRGF